jgi:periplasmic mercuric ion binding protein
MVRWLLSVVPALVLLGAHPAAAAPTVRATVSHMCCGRCVNAIKTGVAGIDWIAEVKPDQASRSVVVTAKDGMTVDVAALTGALARAGFPAQEVVLTGAPAIEVNAGHLCCGGCVGPLQQALGQVAWIASSDVKVNSPVRITPRGDELKLSELMAAMEKAGFSANSITVIAR